MIRVRIRRSDDGSIEGFRVTGHAGFRPSGEDIVCAGVSALVETALLGLEHVAGQPHHAELADGKVDCRLLPGEPAARERAQVILETLVLGLKDIEQDYKRFVRIDEGG